MQTISSLCVYCGSSGTVRDSYRQFATDLGEEMARRGLKLVYGGGRVGLMGLVADGVMRLGGQAVGIIPEFLERYEVGHGGITELVIVDTMHTRKQKMAELSDAFIVLPGGFGTLEEFFEVLTWRQLKLHDKPIIIADVDGYWGKLTELLDHMIEEGFAKPQMRGLWTVARTLDDVFAKLHTAPAPVVEPAIKWT